MIMTEPPTLKPLHVDEELSAPKINQYSKLTTHQLLYSLRPGQPGSLKARPDGTVLDGHHRLRILSERGIDIDGLPREIIVKDSTDN